MSECEGKDFRTEVDDNFLTCPVCYDHFHEEGEQTPAVLGCGHTLCRRCVNHIYGDTRTCPFCKYAMNSTPERCAKNFMVIGMLSFFPRVREPITLLKYAESDIEAAHNKIHETEREVSYYSRLIAVEEANLHRLRTLEAAALSARAHAEAEVTELNRTIATLSELEGTNSGPIQCHFISHPPPPPPRPDLETARNALLGQLQTGTRLARSRTRSFGEEETGTGSISMLGQLQQVLTARRSVNQPAVQVPEREIRGDATSELERVFARRLQGLTVRASMAQVELNRTMTELEGANSGPIHHHIVSSPPPPPPPPDSLESSALDAIMQRLLV
jgi:hypothetical protein